MKKILVFSTNYLPAIGGAELAIKEITDRLPDVGFSLITARLKASLPPFERLGAVAVYRVGVGIGFDKFLLPILGFFKAISLHRQEKFNVLWCMMASQASVAAAFFKITHRHVPLVLTLQEGDEEEHLRRYVLNSEWLYRILIRPWHTLIFSVADSMTVISKHLESRARRFALATPVALVPNGVDYGFFSRAASPEARARIRKEYGIGPHDFLAVTVSRLVKKNCVDDCIKAINLLPPHVKLFVVGVGELEDELKRLASALALSDRIIFIGAVSSDKVPEYLAAADVFIRPSRSEGFGNAFIEAMAARVPVIATPVGGITDFLTDKRTGLLCGVGDPKDIALKIGVVMRDQDLRLSLIDEAETMVKERYEWSAVANQMNQKAFAPLMTIRDKRILITTGIYPPDVGGPALYAKHLAGTFREMGYATSVVSFGKQTLPSGLRYISFGLKLVAPMLSSDWVLTLDTMSVGLPSTMLARLFGRKVVVRIGGDFLWEQYLERTGNLVPLPDFYSSEPRLSLRYRLIFFLTRFVTNLAHVLAFNASWLRDIWAEPYAIESKNAVVVENYYGPKIASKIPERKVFLWAGRGIKVKNVLMLKRAFAAAKRRCPDIDLDIADVPHEALMSRMQNAYAVALPSISEVNPNFILEAVRMNKPFIATKHCGIRDRLNSFGVFVDPLSENEIAEAFCSLANDAVYRSYLEKLGHSKFERDWKAVAGDFVKIFKSL